MDKLTEWLLAHKLPVGKAAKAVINFLTDRLEPLFDGISAALQALFDPLLWILQTPHPLLLIAIFTAAAHLAHRKWPLTAFVAGGLLLIINLGYWKETTDTLALAAASALFCMVFGVPLGIAAAHRPRLFSFMRPVLDLMQTLPTFVYLIPALVLFGLGVVPGLVATVIFAIAAPIRLTHLGISSTPQALLEAGKAFGCSPRQLLLKVELPFALPQIMAGFTQAIMLSLSMVVISAMVGAPGLGVLILRAINQVNVGLGVEAGLAIVIIAIILDRTLRLREAVGH
ncbi:MAG: choline ABC transporter permease subunit [Betaproteobacteria bacterium]|nr:choline ABC transporter permease subunit [Betaproteobacteria bacterium]